MIVFYILMEEIPFPSGTQIHWNKYPYVYIF